MKIKFLHDYAGRETAMTRYFKGDILEIDHQPALELIQNKIAIEYVEKPKVKKEVTDGENS